MAEWNLADILDNVAVSVPDARALTHDGAGITWAELESRANGLARHLLDAGCGHRAAVAFYLHNRPEYCEVLYACAKASLTHVNTNHRYVAAELEYLWTNADAEAVVFQGTFTEQVEGLRDRLPLVRAYVHVDDGTTACPDWAVPYETAVATSTDGSVRCDAGRSDDDLLFMYTGGTTGMPKGVMWRHGDLIAVTDRANRNALPAEHDVDDDGVSAAVRARTSGPGPVSLVACPLMHGTGLFNSINTLMLGGSIVTTPGTGFDPEVFCTTVEAERVKSTFIVGDAFARPIARTLGEHPDRWDMSSLRVMISSGVMWSAEVKAELSRHIPKLIMVDTYGSSEAIGMGSSVSTGDDTRATAKFSLGAGAVVIADDGSIVEPGSGDIGKVGIQGHTPIGYYKDEAKTAATFPVIDGVRYSIPGDYATVEADGTITLLGRGSVCINTGGEKVFPEEVEEVLKTHPAISDAIAVGVPNERFGQAVTAVVVAPADLDTDAAIAHVKANLAGYKAPKQVHVVPSLERASNGKIDYKRWTSWATERS